MDSPEKTLRAFMEEGTLLAAAAERGHGILTRMEEGDGPVTKKQQARVIVVALLQYQRVMARHLEALSRATRMIEDGSAEDFDLLRQC